jgi:cysteine-rich repeat protein
MNTSRGGLRLLLGTCVGASLTLGGCADPTLLMGLPEAGPGDASIADLGTVEDGGAQPDIGAARDDGTPPSDDAGAPSIDGPADAALEDAPPDAVLADLGTPSVDAADAADAADTPAPTCGNGRVDPDERCDTAIRAGAGACVTVCDDRNACTTDSVVMGGTCLAACVSAPITAPRAGDGCCPPGATIATDNDCMARCGDGVVSSGEVCDTAITAGAGRCPTACNDGNVCTTDSLQAGGTCGATCTTVPITMARGGDGCCPPGATLMTDSDCTAVCGDGVRSGSESCDTGIRTGAGACPTACTAPNACTTATLSGGGTCAASCINTAITAARNGDRCCPPGASIATDNDCLARCGDAVVSPGESCDTALTSGAGVCPRMCTAPDACTAVALANAGSCTAVCTRAAITMARNGDGCCPPGASIATDNDCPARCGDGVVSAMEQCDDRNTTPGDGCGATCLREPRAFRMTTLTVQEPRFVLLIDITSNVNSEIAGALTMDRSTPPDGNVDFSPIVYFRPMDQVSASTPLTIDFATCTAPLSSTTCTRGATPTSSIARNTLTGTTACLAPLTGTFPTGRGINAPTPSCFASDSAATLVIDLAGTALRLRDAQVGARYDSNPATQLQTGLIRGFLTQADATAARLPTTIAIVGGRTIASLLRTADQDRLNDGTVGWWFYLNFTASPVRYVP